MANSEVNPRNELSDFRGANALDVPGHGGQLYVVRGLAQGQYKLFSRLGEVPKSQVRYVADRFEIERLQPPSVVSPNEIDRNFGDRSTILGKPYSRAFGDHNFSEWFDPRDLELLGSCMILPRGYAPFGGVHPIGYTYLGQLIIHDVTWLDPKNGKSPVNKASSALDFLSIIGEGAKKGDSPRCPFAVGSTLPSESLPAMFEDLPRCRDEPRIGMPIIADERNDSFLSLAQFQLLFLKFYNALSKCEHSDEGIDSAHIKDLYIEHAQWIVLHDYLPRIVDAGVYCDVMCNGRRFICADRGAIDEFEVPIEFAGAIARFGHAMVRERYDPWNSKGHVGSVSAFAHFSHRNREIDRPMPAIPSDWATSWQHLFNFEEYDGMDLPLRAAPIRPWLAEPMGRLSERLRMSETGALIDGDVFNLAVATLDRQRSLGMPPAEVAIDVMNGYLGDWRITPLMPDRLGAELPMNAAALFRPGGAFHGRTPLWFYTLREAELVGNGRQLGPFASRIFMETLHACIEKSRSSVLGQDGWRPTLPASADNRMFKMPDLIRYATEIDPLI